MNIKLQLTSTDSTAIPTSTAKWSTDSTANPASTAN